MPRTFPDYAMFKNGSYGACELKRVLIAYAIKHPEVYIYINIIILLYNLDWLLSRNEFCRWYFITIFE